MFAVPGWSLGDIKRESERTNANNPTKNENSKKRKRKHEQNAAENTPQTSASAQPQLRPQPGNQAVKRQKRVEDNIGDGEDHTQRKSTKLPDSRSLPSLRNEDPTEPVKTSSKKTEKRRKQRELAQGRTDATPNTTPAAMPTDLPPTMSGTKLTPLQTAMRQKLAGARFRHLNETLYTSPSHKALALFESNPTFFDEYHSGFRQQVSSWPENPVRSFLEDLKKRGKLRPGKDVESGVTHQSLPRNNGVCHVADLGCGDAALAAQLESAAKKLSVKILSYDLHGNSPLVTKADIAHLPAADGSFNVAIFCLALMGTNWIDFIEEAWRVLHWKGELWVAEIKSRFRAPKKRQVLDHSVGKRRKVPKKEDKEGGDEAQMTEVEGAEVRGNETDVSAFVDVLKARGFLLLREGGIDMHNKMFVKMRFIKAMVPSRGKHVGQGQAPNRQTQQPPARRLPSDDADGIDESSVLKPCLYKVR